MTDEPTQNRYAPPIEDLIEILTHPPYNHAREDLDEASLRTWSEWLNMEVSQEDILPPQPKITWQYNQLGGWYIIMVEGTPLNHEGDFKTLMFPRTEANDADVQAIVDALRHIAERHQGI